jgi:hypothetical protein
MNGVTVICTVHAEVGLANVAELAALLESAKPRVIFLEVPHAAFEDFYVNRSRENLESKAVALYRENLRADLIPVDVPTPEREFFEDWDYLIRKTLDASPAFRQLMLQDKTHVMAYGYRYLNSKYCCKLWSDAYDEMRRTVERLAQSRLCDIFTTWVATNAFRENTMMNGIQAYCRTHDFGEGVFLVGAAHRQPLKEWAADRAALGAGHLKWEFLAYGD